MWDARHARDRLRLLGEALGVGDMPLRVLRDLHGAGEPFEVGVAATVARKSARALLYYNPRRRGPELVGRLRALLERRGADPAWLGAVEAGAPLSRLSSIAGVDLIPGGPTGTLYLEEVASRLGPEADDRLAALCTSLSLAPPPAEPRAGAPYIWAVDFDREGPTALKVYHLAEPPSAGEVRREAEALAGPLAPPVEAALFGPGPCAGFIVQRAFDREGALLRHKVYRCYPYETERTAGVAREALARLGHGAPEDPALAAVLDPAFGTTSVGVALRPGEPTPEYATVYQCLLRGDRRRDLR